MYTWINEHKKRSYGIAESVGYQGSNKYKDVLAIQKLLNTNLKNSLTFRTLSVDGICGSKTIAAIRLFQKEVLRWRYCDGLVEPNGKTERALRKKQQIVAEKKSKEVGHNENKPLEERRRVKITYQNSQAKKISQKSMRILEDALYHIGVYSAAISSTLRTPYDQARIMYNNIKAYGVAKQKQLYGSMGDKIIDEYVKHKNMGKGRDAVIKAMEKKIIAITTKNTRVSRHCVPEAIYEQYNVFDVAPSSIPATKRTAFTKILYKYRDLGKITKTIPYKVRNEPAYHIEIKQ